MQFLSLDIGTSSVKAVIFNDNGHILKKRQYETDIICHQPKQAKQDAQKVWQKLLFAMEQVLKDAKTRHIDAICASVQGDAVIPVDENANPLSYALLGMDYTSEEAAQYCKKIFDAKALFRQTGMRIHPLNAITKILKLYQEGIIPYKYVTYSDYILMKLGGEAHIDITMASRSMAMNIKTKDWDDNILARLNLDKKYFSIIKPSGEIVGELKSSLVRKLKLSKPPFLITGGHDQTCSALGAGIIEPGIVLNSLGSAEVIAAVLKKTNVTDIMYDSYYPCYHHIPKNTYFTFSLNHAAGLLVRWYRDQFAQKEVADAQKENMDIYAHIFSQLKQGPSSVMISPYFNGRGTPCCDINAKGAIIGLTMDTTRHDIIQAISEALIYETKINLDTFEQAGIPAQTIRAVGGGAKSQYLLQRKADILQRPIEVPETSETACLGAAIVSAVALGQFQDYYQAILNMTHIRKKFLPERSNIKYNNYFHLYKKLYNDLKPIHTKLSQLNMID